jgi:hypothetical protein
VGFNICTHKREALHQLDLKSALLGRSGMNEEKAFNPKATARSNGHFKDGALTRQNMRNAHFAAHLLTDVYLQMNSTERSILYLKKLPSWLNYAFLHLGTISRRCTKRVGNPYDC